MEDRYKDICYKTSYLKQVIFRIDFPEPIVNERIFRADVDAVVKQYFPIPGKDVIKYINEVSVAADAQTGNVSGHTKRMEGIERTYSDSAQLNKVVFSNEAIIFTYNRYESFEKLYEAVTSILRQLWINNKLLVVRCGLRYVNLYNLLPNDGKVTKAMFSTKLGKVMIPSLVDTIPELQPIRSMITTEYVCDDIKVMYRAGEYNQFYPMPISKDDFALDIDCFTNTGMESAEDISAFVKKAHSLEQYLFEQSINDKMRGVMNNG